MSERKEAATISTDEFPAYVEFTVRMNVESEWEFDTLREDISNAARRMSTVRLVGDEAAVQVLYRKRPGLRPIDSDPQDPPPFTFDRGAKNGRTGGDDGR